MAKEARHAEAEGSLGSLPQPDGNAPAHFRKLIEACLAKMNSGKLRGPGCVHRGLSSNHQTNLRVSAGEGGAGSRISRAFKATENLTSSPTK